MISVLLVFVGGGAGAVCRYGAGRFVGERYSGAFPLGTCLINVSGCFALGVAASLIARNAGWLTALVATGFLGGFTTFSTYALEGVVLAGDRAYRVALLAFVMPMCLGLLAAALGALVA